MQNTDKLAIWREDAARSDIKVLPPDINASFATFMPEGERAIRYGLAAVRNVGDAAMQAFIVERTSNGPFKTVWDMAGRLPSSAMNRRQMEYLIKAGAFDSLQKNRRQLFDALDLVIGYNNTLAREKESKQTSLFGGGASESIPLPAMAICDNWPPMERMEFENEALGFYLSSHPIQGYRSALTRLGVVPSNKLLERLGTAYNPVKIAGLVSKIKVRTSEKGRFAFVTLSDEGGVFEASIFKEEILNRHRALLENGTLIVAAADGKREEGGMRLILQSLQSLEEAIASVKALAAPKKLRITLDSERAIASLKKIIGEPNGVGTQLTLRAPIDANVFADITLPGSYALTPHMLMEIPALEGVHECLEA
jgi:DNA polymerase-3 subunit alpha